MLNFPTWIPDSGSDSPALLDFFLSSDTSISSTLAFLPLGNFDNVVVSVSINFRSTQNGKPRFIAELLAILVLIRVAFVII